jgi:septum formation protein
VITGICLLGAGGETVDHAVTRVWFAPLSAEEIERYAATPEPIDKAGGYAIQGLASKYVERIEGCYFNVVGLPVSLVWRHLELR